MGGLGQTEGVSALQTADLSINSTMLSAELSDPEGCCSQQQRLDLSCKGVVHVHKCVLGKHTYSTATLPNTHLGNLHHSLTRLAKSLLL